MVSFILTVAILTIASIGLASASSIDTSSTNTLDDVVVYQGPVPIGYDLNHFRQTGETVKIGGYY